MVFFQTAVLVGFTMCVAYAQAPGELARDPKSAAGGLAIYRRHCSSCHGNQAEGGRAPNLTTGSLSQAQMFHTISDGAAGTEMAAYGNRLASDDIWRIVIFLSSAARSESAAAGDSTRGATLFWGKGGCGNCHAVGNRGSHVGPDLSGIGRQRNSVYLRESLLEPGADIARGFDGVTVISRDGATLRGVSRALDDFSVVLQDFSGKVYSYDRKDVRSVALDTQSLMPDYGKTLSAAELNDVLAFLLTLRTPRDPEVRRR